MFRTTDSRSSDSGSESESPTSKLPESPIRSSTSITRSIKSFATPSFFDERAATVSIVSSHTTPLVAKKKVVRRTNAQIEIDAATKKAASVAKAELNASRDALRKSEAVAEVAFTELKGRKYSVQLTRSNWTVAEQICLINCYRKWEQICEKSQDKKLIQISKMWLIEIPALMGKDFGKVRLTPSNSLGSSPYKAKWQDIRKKVSDYKAAQPDGREEEVPDVEGPTGGGCDENGKEDERTESSDIAEATREKRRNERYTKGIDKDTLFVVEHYIKMYPQSITGVGLMTERELVSGAGQKRDLCEIAGLDNTMADGGVVDAPKAKKSNKASLILDLTRTAVAHHEENMVFQRSHFEFEKESRLSDITRHAAREEKRVEYRDRQDERDQERYVAEQTRLASAQQDTKDINNLLAGFLTSIVAKL